MDEPQHLWVLEVIIDLWGDCWKNREAQTSWPVEEIGNRINVSSLNPLLLGSQPNSRIDEHLQEEVHFLRPNLWSCVEAVHSIEEKVGVLPQTSHWYGKLAAQQNWRFLWVQVKHLTEKQVYERNRKSGLPKDLAAQIHLERLHNPSVQKDCANPGRQESQRLSQLVQIIKWHWTPDLQEGRVWLLHIEVDAAFVIVDVDKCLKIQLIILSLASAIHSQPFPQPLFFSNASFLVPSRIRWYSYTDILRRFRMAWPGWDLASPRFLSLPKLPN